ncbi:MAG: hypothetical protein DRH08_12395 [Deltaproteobacteria bacterium]|nr:MAG: hypothetical protein DRH08_12395 [Deltaproteobacteria bacterium]
MGKRKDGTNVSTITSVSDFGEGEFMLRRESTPHPNSVTTLFVHYPDGKKVELKRTGTGVENAIREFRQLPGVKEAHEYREAKHAQEMADDDARWAAIRAEKARRAAMTHCPHCEGKL